MIKILTGSQMADIDKKATQELNIPVEILMENAGSAVAQSIFELIEDTQDETVLVICGKGNNGGDGFAAARHLIENNIETIVVSLYREKDLSQAAFVNHNILKHFTDIVYLDEIDVDYLAELVSSSDIVVDAILGTGLSSPVKDKISEVIDVINKNSRGAVVAVDIPSGLDSQSGKILGNAVMADYTVTFFAPKLGTILYPGADISGEIILCDIGIPKKLLKNEDFKINLLTCEYVSSLLPYRPDNSNKGTFGNVLTVSGSTAMSGAAFLSANSSFKAGAGYSTLACPKSIVPVIASMSPEIVFLPLEETKNGTISEEAVEKVLEKALKSTCVLIGPGLSTESHTFEFVLELTKALNKTEIPIIYDADALNCFAMCGDCIFPKNSIITPHPKELSRLLKVSLEEILKDRIASSLKTAEKLNTTVVLKGPRTIIADTNGNVYVNPTGNSALAKAGTGDVLSGMIAGFAAQGLSLLEAAQLAVYLHGLAGEAAAEDLSEYCVCANNLPDYIPDAVKIIEGL